MGTSLESKATFSPASFNFLAGFAKTASPISGSLAEAGAS
jgi:hypothetical protein